MTIADSRVVAHRWLRNGKYTFTGWVGGVPSNFSLSAQNQCVETHGATWTVEYAVPLHLLAEAESTCKRLDTAYLDAWNDAQNEKDRADALQSRLDAVVALADEMRARLDAKAIHVPIWHRLYGMPDELRSAALGGECRGDGEDGK